MRLHAVDPRGDDLAAWHAVHAACRRHDRPGDVVPPLAELRAGALAGLPARDPSEEVRHVLALADDGRPVGAALVELPLRDNTHLLWCQLYVLPAERRAGVGSALLTHVAGVAGTVGRTLVGGELDEPPEQVDASPGRGFLRAQGFVEVLREVRRDLTLPVEPDRLDHLEEQARPHAAGYELLVWRDRCPDELVDARAELGRVMSLDAPTGDADWREESWDAARVREREQIAAEKGRSLLTAAARHTASGTLVGFTELAVRPDLPAEVEQWETLVVQAHRGHRLGLLLKTAALRRLGVDVPDARLVHTTNAESNAPMIAVNEALGFRPNGVSSCWQRPVRPR